MHRILIAEDESRIAAFLEKGLRANGFAIAIAKNGCEAVQMACSEVFDLMLLDLRLPCKDGWVVLEEVRGQGQRLPIIILSALDEISDKVAGLEGGADDYITKPFRFEELLARVRVRLRNGESIPKPEAKMLLKVGTITLDLQSRKAWVGDRSMELSPKEFSLAEIFLRHPGQVFSREVLLDRVWGFDYEPGSNVVDVYVGYLRRKFGSKVIQTVRGSATACANSPNTKSF
ncbi:MAG: response regulator transcription factor [Coleofasciculaceae cyanobacterium SM2_3_26]|nr:response regulator transcription factor [Coleofasciculaceae cyanobacterium SM2_3_26]